MDTPWQDDLDLLDRHLAAMPSEATFIDATLKAHNLAWAETTREVAGLERR